MYEVAASSTGAVMDYEAVVLGHGKPMFRGAVATPKLVLHAPTQEEHRSPTHNFAIRCLWSVQ
jgi:hypothetical protein